MIFRRIFEALPGSLPVRILISAVLIAALLVALHFFYTWVGNNYLDTGGGVG